MKTIAEKLGLNPDGLAAAYFLDDQRITESNAHGFLQLKKSYANNKLVIAPCPKCGMPHVIILKTGFGRPEVADEMRVSSPCGPMQTFVSGRIDHHELARQIRMSGDPTRWKRSQRAIRTLAPL